MKKLTKLALLLTCGIACCWCNATDFRDLSPESIYQKGKKLEADGKIAEAVQYYKRAANETMLLHS